MLFYFLNVMYNSLVVTSGKLEEQKLYREFLDTFFEKEGKKHSN